MAALALFVLLMPASAAFAHPDHGPGVPAPVSQPGSGGGGTSGLVIAAVAVGLIGLGVGLGALKYVQTQKARGAATAAEESEPASPGTTSAQT